MRKVKDYDKILAEINAIEDPEPGMIDVYGFLLYERTEEERAKIRADAAKSSEKLLRSEYGDDWRRHSPFREVREGKE